MRMSRSRISVGAPTREILAAQQLAQKAATQFPDATIPAAVPEAPPTTAHVSPVSESKSSSTEPENFEPAVESAAEDDSAPPRPTFKEPPPEDDDTPPMPSFKEPPSEDDDIPGTQPPSFISPPVSPPPVIDEKPPSPVVSVMPATPHNPIKGLRRNSALQSGSPSPLRSPSPRVTPPRSATPVEDQVLGAGATGLSRHSSGQVGVRGPRLSRGPRPPGGGSVSNIVANLNRSSASKSPPPTYKRLSGGTRPSSIAGSATADGKGRFTRNAAFSRRTMASDAEDDVVSGA